MHRASVYQVCIFIIFVAWVRSLEPVLLKEISRLFRPKTNTLVSGNAGDDKNLHLDDSKFIFFNQFSGDILLSSLVSIAFFILVFFVLCLLFFELKKFVF